MSQRHEAEQQLALYGDLGEIMGAMKNLAQVELHRVSRLTLAQQVCRQHVRQAMEVYALTHAVPPLQKEHRQIYIVIGSERGFCASFNDAPKNHVYSLLERAPRPAIILVGSRLAVSCGSAADGMPVVAGANTALEISAVLEALVEQLDRILVADGFFQVTVVYPSADGLQRESILPFKAEPQENAALVPARLNVSPESLFAALARHWLYHSLLAALYISLQTENHMRLGQMEGAIRHLNDSSDALKVQINRLRQEAIVEEIEVIFSKQQGAWLQGDRSQ